MADYSLSEKIPHLRSCIQKLQDTQGFPPPNLSEALEELQVSLEELHVAQEEVEERTEALADANRMLEEERRRYRELFDYTPGGCAVTNADGIIREANFGVAGLLNVPRERLAGKPITLYVSEADRRLVRTWLASFAGEIASAKRTSEAATGLATKEIELQPRAGAPFPAAVTVAPIRTTDGIVQGFYWLCQDITERKRAEAERTQLDARLQGAQRLESLAVLAGGVAHDLNNLLTTMLGNADMAAAQVAAESPTHTHLDAITVAARRAADLSNQLLAFSGKGRFVVEPVSLQTLIREMQPLLETAVSSRCRIEYDLSPAAVIEADLTQIRQIVTNLIMNAAEATGEHGGTIEVRVGSVVCDPGDLAKCVLGQDLPGGSYACVEVSDTGCGMTPEVQERIFEPFFSTKRKGRGLGLAAVLGIVRGHRGALEVVSSPGRGATIRVFFPMTSRSVAAAGAGPPAAVSIRRSGTVLVVDDETSLRTVAHSILESAGFTVLTAVDGVDAVEVFQAHVGEIRAVLLDLTMPRMCGVEALHHLREIDSEVLVVLTSGFSEQECVGHVTGDRRTRFLQKPYRKADLVGLLHDALEAERPDRGALA
jgi:PAS domain S-box-containing protein